MKRRPISSSRPASQGLQLLWGGPRDFPLLITVGAWQRRSRLTSLQIVDDGLLLQHKSPTLVDVVLPVEQANTQSETVNLHKLAIPIILVAAIFVSKEARLNRPNIAYVHQTGRRNRIDDVSERLHLRRGTLRIRLILGLRSWNFESRSGLIPPHTPLRHRQVLIESFEAGRITPVQFGRSIIDVITVESPHVPRIAIRTLRPNEITTTRIGTVGVIGNDGTENGVRVAWGHVLVDAVWIGHDEIVQHVFGPSWT
jgi:hypothetical protein